MSHVKFARFLQVSYNKAYGYEFCTINPKLEDIVHFAKRLGCPREKFLGMEPVTLPCFNCKFRQP